MNSDAVIPLYTKEQLQQRLQSLAKEAAEKLPENTLVIALLKGAFVFAADFMRALNNEGLDLEIDFMSVSSYGKSTTSSGKINIKLDCQDNLQKRPILLVDDILDTGNTVAAIRQHLTKKGATNIQVCVLLDKPARRTTREQADFVGFTVPDKFIVGYGIDYAERFRSLPYIGIPKEFADE
ncbi:hypoxanthine phosphoribosyltransferase [Magnetococcales bacterium HHB-1]